MPRSFSSEQNAIFETRRRESPWIVNDNWINLYALLGVAPDAHPRDIDDAIVGRSAECLQYAFSRAGSSAYIETVERHLPDFRRVLLYEKQRVRYDELLIRHNNGTEAMSYEEFIDSLPPDDSAAGCLTVIIWLAFGALAGADAWSHVLRA